MDKNRYIPRIEDQKKFDNLIKDINANLCVAFVGAGISVNKGYRIWDRFIFDRSSKGLQKGLLEFSNLREIEVNGKSHPEIIDICQKKLKDKKYLDFIKAEYERKSNEISDTHTLVCRTNFKHIVTTNFDPCLYDNSEGLISEIRVYPGNTLELLPQRTLYHIHGRAFLFKGEDELKLNAHLKRLIFGEKSFKKAYQDGMEIMTFIYRLIQQYSIVFFGFSLNDQIFTKTFKAVAQARLNFMNEFSEINSVKNYKKDIGYIFLEYPTDAYEKIKSSLHILSKDEKDKLIKQINDFLDKEKEMNAIGINVIGFNKTDEQFSGLVDILQIIKNDATLSGLLKPYEKINASVMAFTTGSLK